MKNAIIYVISVILISLLVLILLTPSRVVSVAKADEEHIVPFIVPQLQAICGCESVGSWNAEPQHWDSQGNVLRGRLTPEDIGQCQINTYYHGKQAEKMGIDIYSFNGNRIYANYLYETQGTKPWSASRRCWDK